MSNNIDLEKFCTVSGMKESDKRVALKKYGSLELKAYDSWFELISVDFTIPNNVGKFFKEIKVQSQEKTYSKKTNN